MLSTLPWGTAEAPAEAPAALPEAPAEPDVSLAPARLNPRQQDVSVVHLRNAIGPVANGLGAEVRVGEISHVRVAEQMLGQDRQQCLPQEAPEGSRQSEAHHVGTTAVALIPCHDPRAGRRSPGPGRDPL